MFIGYTHTREKRRREKGGREGEEREGKKERKGKRGPERRKRGARGTDRERRRKGEGENWTENSMVPYLPGWQPTLHIPIKMKDICVCQTLPFAFSSSSLSLLSERGIKPAANTEQANSYRHCLPGNANQQPSPQHHRDSHESRFTAAQTPHGGIRTITA